MGGGDPAEEYDRIQAGGGRRAEIYRALRGLRDGMELIRTRYPDIPRRVSGYNLDSLLPEKELRRGPRPRRLGIHPRHRPARRDPAVPRPGAPVARRPRGRAAAAPPHVRPRPRRGGPPAPARPLHDGLAAAVGQDRRVRARRRRHRPGPDGKAPPRTGPRRRKRLRDQTSTLAELLDEHQAGAGGVSPGASHGVVAGLDTRRVRAVAQPHCHQHAIMGFGTDERVPSRAGVDVETLDVGCCGLAGNFGFERGHYEVSTAVAGQGIWPAVQERAPGTAVLADGFSCRTQTEAGTGARPCHLAEVLAARRPGERP